MSLENNLAEVLSSSVFKGVSAIVYERGLHEFTSILTSTLPEQTISNENPMTQISDDLEGIFQRNLTTSLTQTSIRQQMNHVLHLLTSINSLLSFILPVYIESNDEKIKDKISLTINEILSRRKLKKIILHLIEHLTGIPFLINAFCVDVNDPQSSMKHNCYQIELEAWIRAYEMKRLVSCCIVRTLFIVIL
ncbi:unnamed protein product [Trichobilharzia regenti]|nr:unnamed protein product [Trichobilharzia regenti]